MRYEVKRITYDLTGSQTMNNTNIICKRSSIYIVFFYDSKLECWTEQHTKGDLSMEDYRNVHWTHPVECHHKPSYTHHPSPALVQRRQICRTSSRRPCHWAKVGTVYLFYFCTYDYLNVICNQIKLINEIKNVLSKNKMDRWIDIKGCKQLYKCRVIKHSIIDTNIGMMLRYNITMFLYHVLKISNI